MVMTWGWLIKLGDLGKLLSTCVQWDDSPSASAAVWNSSGQPVSALSGAALMRYVQSVPRQFAVGLSFGAGSWGQSDGRGTFL